MLNHLEIRQPIPSQNTFQLLPQLHNAIIPALARNLGPLARAELHDPSQHGAVDDSAPAGRLDAHGVRHLAEAMGLGVEAAVRRERRVQLVGDAEEAAVGRLGERGEGGDVAGGRAEEEEVRRGVRGWVRGGEGSREEEGGCWGVGGDGEGGAVEKEVTLEGFRVCSGGVSNAM